MKESIDYGLVYRFSGLGHDHGGGRRGGRQAGMVAEQ